MPRIVLADLVRLWQGLFHGSLVSAPVVELMRTPTPQSVEPMPTQPE